MPSDFSSYIALLKLVDDASKSIGLSHLTSADKHLLLALCSFADKSNEAHNFTYAAYCDSVEQGACVSRAQFFKSLNVLLEAKAISKLGLQRSASYMISV